MPRLKLHLGLGSYQSRTLPFSAQRCVNLYAGIAQAVSLSEFALFRTPGVTQFTATNSGKGRGAIEMSGLYYTVSGTQLFEINKFGTALPKGTIAGEARVVMAHNGEKLVIVVPGGNSYEFNATTEVLTQITDPDFRISDTVCFKDGFFIFTATDSDIFFNSQLNDPLNYDPLDFGTAELAPDGIVGCHVNHDEVYILGERTTEVFQNVGGAGFPFQRIPGASFEKGAHSKYGTIQWEGFFYFIGGGSNEKTAIWIAGGTAQPQRISTDAIDHEIQLFARDEIANAFSFTYTVDGASFVGFTFRSVNIPSRTFLYNVTAGRQSRRPIWFEQQTGVTDNAWRIQSVVNVFSKLLVSDITDGRIGFLDQNLFTEYGAVIRWEKVTGPFAGDGSSLFLSELELTADSGRGTIGGQGIDPVVTMEFSDDGGRVFSFGTERPLGKIGEFFRRTIWRRVGRIPAHRVFRFWGTDPTPVTLIKLEARAERGR